VKHKARFAFDLWEACDIHAYMFLDFLREHTPEATFRFEGGAWTVTIGAVSRTGSDLETVVSDAMGAYLFVTAPIKSATEPTTEPVIHDKTRAVLAKAEALLAKASSTTSLDEAATCARIAQELLFKHRLSVVDIAKHDDPIQDQVVPIKTHPFVDTWKIRLVARTAKANGCYGYAARKKSGVLYRLVGRQSDLSLAQFVIVYLLFQIEALCKAHAQGKGRTWANNFRLGAVDAIASKMDEAVASVRKEVEGSTALVKLDQRKVEVDEWVDNKLQLKPIKPEYEQDTEAYRRGFAAGNKLDLSKAKPSV